MKRSLLLGSLMMTLVVTGCGGGVAPIDGQGSNGGNGSSGSSGGGAAGSSGGASGTSGGTSSSSGGTSGSGGTSSSGGTSGGTSGTGGSSGTTGTAPTTFTAPPSELELGSTGSAGGEPANYSAGIDATTTIDGANAELLASQPGTSANAYAQTSGYKIIDASYWGKRYRMRVKVKTETVDYAYVYFEIDAQPASYVIDNMMIPTDRSIKGTTPFQEISLVLDVPPDSSDFAFGSGLVGNGKIWIGTITFEEVAKTVPTTPHGFGGSSP